MKKTLFYSTLIAQIVLALVVSYVSSEGIALAQSSDSNNSCPSGQVPVTDGDGNPKYDSDGHPICRSIDALGPLGP
jgi:hypothetical protein